MSENGPSAGDWQRVSDLLGELLELPTATQESRLQELSEADPLISEELRRLLESDRAAGLLDRPLSESLETLIQSAAAESDPVPERIGPYRVVRELGRGGMGVVYLAERSDGEFEQSVALKLVKRGLDTDAILARFRRERQILARLQHPAIGRLFDGGAALDGRPFFAMELVDGEPITESCDRQGARVRQRLQLFQRACEAVQYAHGQLVVHRDLKPSNILCEENGGLKLLDFGIARLLNDDSEDATKMTVVGLRPLTPAYAAPEQLAGEAATVATDVFALGVILCELLTGLRPDALGRPDSPTLASSLATSTSPDGTSALERATVRGGLEPPTLGRRLSGDLDAIVSKAVHTEPERRYPSAEALSRDVSRHLSGLPVEAAPDSALYRTRKFITRHRVGVASALALATALLLGIAGTAWQARQKALEARKAQEVKEFALGLFAAVDPSLAQGEEVTALELVAQGAKRVRTELDGQPEIQAEMEQLLGEVNWNLGKAEVGLEMIERALGRLPDTTVSSSRASTLRSKGGILVDLGRPDEAEAPLREALAMHERTVGPNHPEVAEDLDRLAMWSMSVGQIEEAREFAVRSLAVRLASLGQDHVETADSYNNLGVLSRQAGDYEAAEQSYRRALAIRQDQLGDRHPETLDSLGNFATLLYFRGKYEPARERFAEVVAIHDEVFGAEHPSTVRARNNLAVMLIQLARYDEAEPLLGQVLAFWEEATGLDHPNALGTRSNLALIERMRGDLQAAEESDRTILDKAVGVLGDGHPLSARFSSRLAASLRETGRLEEAMEFVEGSLSTNENAFGAEAPQVATDLHLIGLVARDLELLDPALESLHRALAIRTGKHGLQSVFTAETQSELGEVVRRNGDVDRALELLRFGLETHRAELPEGHPAIARSAWLLARALVDTGDLAAADSLLTEAHLKAGEAFGEQSWRTAAIAVDLGLCKLLSGDTETGSRLVTAALDELEGRLGADHPLHRSAASRARELSGTG